MSVTRIDPIVVSKRKAELRRKIAKQKYDLKGISAIYGMANRLGMSYSECTPCEASTPDLATVDSCECLVCGSSK